jgi:hypothetical protein
LALREQWFGPRFLALAACPRCGEPVELSFDAGEIRAVPEAVVEEIAVEEPLALTADGFTLRFRLPDSLAVAALPAGVDTSERVRLLLRECVLGAERGGEEVPAGELSGAAVEAVADRMAEADPQADVRLALACPACGEAWAEAFDIASYLWIEVDAWARRLLREVHRLASAYCWGEAEILAMGPLRRQAYLEMLNA